MIVWGVDLGSSAARAARLDPHGHPVLVADLHRPGVFATPSLLLFAEGGVIVGSDAADLLPDLPTASRARDWRSRLGDGEPVARDTLGRPWSATAATAVVLKKLVRDLRAACGAGALHTAIAVPSEFTAAQRQALLHAAELAETARPVLVDEPLAAAHGCLPNVADDRVRLFLDCGRSQCQAAVLRFAAEGPTLVAARVSPLGGEAVDAAVARWLCERSADSTLSLAELLPACEELKRQLLLNGKESERTGRILGGRYVELALHRTRLSHLAEPFVKSCLELADAALQAAGFTWNEMAEIWLHGGASGLPELAARIALHSGLPAEKIRSHHSVQAVAYGAARLAVRSGGEALVHRTGSAGVCAWDLGFRILDATTGRTQVDVVIPRYSPLPAMGDRIYRATRPDQARLFLDVVRVSERQAQPESVGQFAFPLRSLGERATLKVTIACDAAGRVRVSARDVVSGQEVRQELGAPQDARGPSLEADRELLRQAVIWL